VTLTNNEIAIRIAGGAAVVVPADVNVATTYVLLEQEDWFEDEIRFMRRFLEAGMRALDIGANFGVYSLSIAKAVGPSGRVIAFEPGRACVAALNKSVVLNGFENMIVKACAVGAAAGTARLGQTAHELRSIVEAPPGGSADEVPVVALDELFVVEPPGRIDFVKLDVEGAESDVVRGGRRFFAEQSPLIVTEVKQVTYEFGHVRLLGELGYRPYRYVGSLGLLAPVTALDLSERIASDGSLLNLFCCKDDSAEALERRGLLAREAGTPASGDGVGLIRAQRGFAPFLSLADRFDPIRVPGGMIYARALNHYAAARDPSLSNADRLASLEQAALDILEANAVAVTAARHFTAFRILLDAGWIGVAMAAMHRVWRGMSTGQLDLTEPFLLPLARDDAGPASREAIGAWLSAQVAEAAEFHDHMSSYYTSGVLDRVGAIAQAGLLTPALERRRQLYRIRRGEQIVVEASPLLRRPGATLNPDLWDPGRPQAWVTAAR
jgi:FkbM family methyltransferase